MKNAEYWIPAAGQLQQGERVDAGYRSAREAWATYKRLGRGRVACLRTIESDRPIEDPAYAPFESARYCVIVVE